LKVNPLGCFIKIFDKLYEVVPKDDEFLQDIIVNEIYDLKK
jgi:hypothetical protein